MRTGIIRQFGGGWRLQSGAPRTLVVASLALFLWHTHVAAEDVKPLAETTVGMSGQPNGVVLPGPELQAKPLDDRKSPVVLRVVRVYPHGTAFRYDLEYYGLTPGIYDLRDFLLRKDGSPAAGIPSMPVKVNPLLPPGRSSRTSWRSRPGRPRRVPDASDVLSCVWVIGLVALIASFFFPRRKRSTAAGDKPVSLAERLCPLVEGATAGTLSSAELAELERALLAYWRKALGLDAGRAGRSGRSTASITLRPGRYWRRPGGVAASARSADAGGCGRPACPIPRSPARCHRPPGDAMNLKDIPVLWPQFAYPEVLYVLAVPVLFLAWVWSNRWLLPGRRVVLPLDRELAAEAAGGGGRDWAWPSRSRRCYWRRESSCWRVRNATARPAEAIADQHRVLRGRLRQHDLPVR